jgi:hypothetical protein
MHKPRLHLSQMYFYVEYIRYYSQTRNGRLSPAQTSTKVNSKFLSH